MRWLLLPLLILPLAGCAAPVSHSAPDAFACTVAPRSTAEVEVQGHTVPPAALDRIFARLDARARVEVVETNCEISLVSLRYERPRRMQLAVRLNITTGAGGHQQTLREPPETEIGNRLEYAGNTHFTPWPGLGVTAHRLLLPDAWRGTRRSRAGAPDLYLVQPPQYPIRDLSVHVLALHAQHIFVERWRSVYTHCLPGERCPAPISDPRFYARFTAVLYVNNANGLPTALAIVAQTRAREGGRRIWMPPIPVSKASFRYGGQFSIYFTGG